MAEHYSVPDLLHFATEVLQAAGLPEEPARIVAEGLLEADLYGHTTHGLALLEDYVDELQAGTMTRTGKPKVLQDFGAIARWDARRLPGIWTTALAVDEAHLRAGKFGLGAVAIAYSHHIGCLAAFLEKPARKNIAVLVLSSDPSDAMVAPYGGITPVLTPNPIAVGIPAEPDPILIDISTSITTAGMCSRLRNEGKRLPGPWLVNQAGKASDDPHVLNKGGAMLPIGGFDHGHKGFALGLMVEALTQGLSGYGRIEAPTQWGAAVLVLAFATEIFGNAEGFIEQVNDIIKSCQAATSIPGEAGVRIPGQHALARKRDALKNGLTLYPGIAESLERLAQRYTLITPAPVARTMYC